MVKKFPISTRKHQLKILLQIFIVFVLTLAFPFSSINSPVAHAQEILLQEDFNDGDANDGKPVDWEENIIPPGGWEIIDGEYVGSSLSVSQGGSLERTTAGEQGWTNYSLEVSIKGLGGVDRHIIFRYDPSRGWGKEGYWFKYWDANYGFPNHIWLGKGSAGPIVGPRSLDSFKSRVGEKHRFKIEVIENHIKISEINQDGSRTLLIDHTDNNEPLLSGRIGFVVQAAGFTHSNFDGWTKTAYDDLVVKKIAQFPFEIQVPDIKQYSALWGNNVYNRADHWATTEPTIERWGCVLTSAVMVLQYFGHNVWPDSLNNWLTEQPDGYIRNGLLNWLAVSRYTREKADKDSPTLLFRRYEANDNKLEEKLIDRHPPILELSGHFVVAKGKQNSDFLINDPASETNSLLSDVEAERAGDYSAINSYVPTSTNLSAILLVSDGDTKISLFDPSGNLIEEATSYIQESLVDDRDKTSTSGEDLQILLLQEPQEEVYLVKAEGGDGPFQLEAYLYNEEGELIDNKIPSLNSETPSIFQLIYDEDPETETIQTTFDTFDTFLQGLKILWSIGWIDDYNVYLGLKDKLLAAEFLYLGKTKTKPAKNILRAFRNQLNAQREKHIIEPAYQILSNNLQSLQDSL